MAAVTLEVKWVKLYMYFLAPAGGEIYTYKNISCHLLLGVYPGFFQEAQLHLG